MQRRFCKDIFAMERVVEIRGSGALRALAHPLRARLLVLLRTEGPLTASEAGRLVGESSGSCSYHFRQLERYGLVEVAEGGKGREKPWRATATHTNWPSVAETPDEAAAAEALERLVVGHYSDWLYAWVSSRAREPAEWQQAASLGDTLLYLTPDELAGIRDALQALADPYLDRLSNPELRPEGSRPVYFLPLALPQVGEGS
jgi:DNA-binding transcriptional ArsR family regulator